MPGLPGHIERWIARPSPQHSSILVKGEVVHVACRLHRRLGLSFGWMAENRCHDAPQEGAPHGTQGLLQKQCDLPNTVAFSVPVVLGPNQPDTAHLPRPRTVSEPFAKPAPHIPAPSPATSGPRPLHGNSHLPNVCKKLLVTTCVWQCMFTTMRCFARYYYSLRIRSGQYIRELL